VYVRAANPIPEQPKLHSAKARIKVAARTSPQAASKLLVYACGIKIDAPAEPRNAGTRETRERRATRERG
jgi:hypothetical protein